MLVFQVYGMDNLAFFGFALIIAEGEVQNANAIDGFQVVVPPALLGLLPDGESGIIDGSFLEIVLLCLLEFHNEPLALFIFAVNVINRFPVGFRLSELFGILERKAGYCSAFR